MRLIEAKAGSFVRRIWDSDAYIIMIKVNNARFFMNLNEQGNWVTENDVGHGSIVWGHEDFEYCSRDGRPITKAGVKVATKQGKDATKKREYIIQQLEEKKKSLEAVSMYQLLADVDPEAKKLVEELKALI